MHQASYIHSRFTKKFNKSLILTQNFDKMKYLTASINAEKKNGSAEQILLDGQCTLNWYD